MFPLTGLKTTDGQEVEVIDPGLHNHNAGPDFFNAKVKIGGTLWVGNVEIHDRASDWFLHRHDHDPNYNNVILHVVESIDVDVKTRQGDYPPQMRLQVPTAVRAHYEDHSKPIKPDGSLVDECLADRTVGTEDRGDSATCERL